jgi:hypothetical protein
MGKYNAYRESVIATSFPEWMADLDILYPSENYFMRSS